MNKHCFLLLVVLCTNLRAQTWTIEPNFPNTSMASGIQVLSDGSVITMINSEEKIYLEKYDTEGSLLKTMHLADGIGHSITLNGSSLFISALKKVNWKDFSIIHIVDLNLENYTSYQYGEGFISNVIVGNEGTYFVGGQVEEWRSDPFLVKNGTTSFSKIYDFISPSYSLGIIEIDEELIMIARSVRNSGLDSLHFVGIDINSGEEKWRKGHELESPYSNAYSMNSDYTMTSFAYDPIHKVIHIAMPILVQHGDSHFIKADTKGNIIGEYDVFSGQRFHPFKIEAMDNGNILVAGMKYEYDESYNRRVDKITVEMRNSDYQVIWKNDIGRGAALDFSYDNEYIYVSGITENWRTTGNLPYHPVLSKLHFGPPRLDSKNDFIFYEDSNLDGVLNSDDKFLQGIGLEVEGSYSKSDSAGIASIDKGGGTYDLNLSYPSHLSPLNAPPLISFYEDSTVLNKIGFSKEECIDISTAIATSELIRCKSGSAIVSVKNNGTQIARNLTVSVIIDQELDHITSAENFNYINGAYEFTVQELNSGESKNISVDFDIPCDIDLHATKCFEVNHSTRIMCNQDSSDNLPQISTTAKCTGKNVVLSIINSGADMDESSTYNIYRNANLIEQSTFKLDASEIRDYIYESDGYTYTISTAAPIESDKLLSNNSSIESCGSFASKDYSKGIKTMFQTEPSASSDVSCKLITDIDRKGILNLAPHGLGRFHLVNNDITTRFTGEIMIDLEEDDEQQPESLELQIPDGINPNSLEINLCNATYTSKLISNNSYVIDFIDLNAANEIGKLTLKFSFHLKDNFSTEPFMNIRPYLIKTDTLLQYEGAIINYDTNLNDFQLSPRADLEDTYLFGKASRTTLISTAVFDNRCIILGSMIEYGQDQNMILYTIDNNDNLIDSKEIKITEGNAYPRGTLKINENEFWVYGSHIDVDARSFSNYTFAFIAAYDNEGNEKWKKYWKPGTGITAGGNITQTTRLNDNTILLAGRRYKGPNDVNYVMAVDTLGNIKWTTDLYYGLREHDGLKGISRINDNEALVYAEEYRNYFYRIDSTGTIVDAHVVERSENDLFLSNDILHIDSLIVLTGPFRKNYTSSDTTVTRNYFLDLNYDTISIIDIDFYTKSNQNLSNAHLSFNKADSAIYLTSGIIDNNNQLTQDIYWQKLEIGNDSTISGFVDANGVESTKGVFTLGNGSTAVSIDAIGFDSFGHRQIGYKIINRDSGYISDTNELDKKESFYLYPNPTNQYFQTSPDIEVLTIWIVDSHGKLVYKNSGTEQHNISHLEDGIYFVVAEDSKRIRRVQKLVKAKD